MPGKKGEQHHAYLLRCWREGKATAGETPHWRFYIEEVLHVFPGITDQEEEIEALINLIKRTGVNFIHLKNLNIDPHLYMKEMPVAGSRAVGIKRMIEIIKKEFPDLKLGYFNQPVR